MTRNADSPSPPPASDAASSSDNTAAPAVTPSGANTAPVQPTAQTTQHPPRLALLIATGFGLGYLPKAPGTWGSLGGVAFAFAFWHYWEPWWLLHDMGFDLLTMPTPVLLALNYLPLPVVALIGVWVAGKIAVWRNSSDPQEITIDEISGQLVALLIPMGQCRFWPSNVYYIQGPEEPSWKYVIPGLILFRVFDIWKPWPVRAAERLPGGWGIMADDWVAGIYAALCLWALRALGM